MADDIYTKYNIDINKLKRDYIKNPLNKIKINTPTGYYYEKPYKEDLEYLYIELNIPRIDLISYFNVSRCPMEKWLKYYNIKKDTKLQQINRNYNSRIKYGYNYPWQNQTIKDKLKKTLLKKYGVDNIAKLDYIKVKEHKTKKKNKSYGKSKEEDKIYNLLVKKYKKVIRQYINEKYPFACDFYIQDIDTYIEYQGYWTHGKEPYIGTKEQKEIIKLWESKHTNHYNNAINVWTNRDVLKRKIAKNNNLKWFEFFNIDEFMMWFKS